jgi:hypothetical protein
MAVEVASGWGGWWWEVMLGVCLLIKVTNIFFIIFLAFFTVALCCTYVYPPLLKRFVRKKISWKWGSQHTTHAPSWSSCLAVVFEFRFQRPTCAVLLRSRDLLLLVGPAVPYQTISFRRLFRNAQGISI